METEHDIRIKEAQEKIAAVVEKMELVYQDIIEATNQFASEFYQSHINEAIKNRADRIQQLNDAGNLSTVKTELKNFVANASSIVNRYLSSNNLWDHKKVPTAAPSLDFSEYAVYSSYPPRRVDDAFRFILGAVGESLTKHGLGENRQGYVNFWKMDYSNNAYKYNSAYSISKDLKNAFDRYNKLHEQLRNNWTELTQALRLKTQSEAQNLWDQA